MLAIFHAERGAYVKLFFQIRIRNMLQDLFQQALRPAKVACSANADADRNLCLARYLGQ